MTKEEPTLKHTLHRERLKKEFISELDQVLDYFDAAVNGAYNDGKMAGYKQAMEAMKKFKEESKGTIN